MGGNCYRISNVKILSKCNWLSINNMICHSTLTFIHKIKTILNNKSINELFLCVKSLRNHCKSITKYEPKSTIFQNFFIYRGNTLYNEIPNVIIKKKKINIFKKCLKNYLQSNFHPFKIKHTNIQHADSSESSFVSSDDTE